MTRDTGVPTKILAFVESRNAQGPLRSALALPERHGAALEVMACVEPPHDLAICSRLVGKDAQTLITEAVERRRSELRARHKDILHDRPVDLHVSVGKAYVEIIRHVAASGCDVVIKMAATPSGVQRIPFASTDQHLLRKCLCPVWLQTEATQGAAGRVLAAVDLDLWDAAEPDTLTALNHRVVDTALTIAEGPDAEIVVLHAWETAAEGMVWAFAGGRDARISADRYVNEILQARKQAMSEFLAEVRQRSPTGPRVIPHLARGAPHEVIRDHSREVAAGVIVMGTVARTGLRGVFIGNAAENIINTIDRSVVAVKPEGFVSPLLQG